MTDRVSAFRSGHGKPLVLIPPVGGTWHVFEPILDRLSEHRDVIAVDLPGAGDTAGDDNVPATPKGYAGWVSDYAAGLGITDFEVAGCSIGAAIGLELGYAGRVSRVTAFSPIGFGTRAEILWLQSVARATRMAGRPLLLPLAEAVLQTNAGRVALLGLAYGKPWLVDPGEAVRGLAAAAASSGQPAAISSFGDYNARQFQDEPGGLRQIPVTVAWGDRDLVTVQFTQAARARTAMPWANHVTLAGCGHVPFSDDPDRCLEVLLAASSYGSL